MTFEGYGPSNRDGVTDLVPAEPGRRTRRAGPTRWVARVRWSEHRPTPGSFRSKLSALVPFGGGAGLGDRFDEDPVEQTTLAGACPLDQALDINA